MIKLFGRKLENEGDMPANWQSDEVYVREGGEIVKIDPPDKDGDEDAADD